MLHLDQNNYSCPDHWLTQSVNIALVGVGATGCAVSSLLFKLNHIRREITQGEFGINLYLFDPKRVTETGKNRTGFLRHEVGMNKAQCMANKLNTSYGKMWCQGVPQPFSFKSLAHQRSKLDVIITATDSAASRNQLFHDSRNITKTLLWLDIGVGETKGNVVLGELGKGLHRLPTVCDLFNTAQAEVDDKELRRPSCDTLDAITRQAFCVNECAAANGIALLSTLMLHGRITTQGCILDIAACQSSPIRIDRDIWKSFGYRYRANPMRLQQAA